MDLSLFLAKVMGLYFLIISASVLINKGRFTAIVNMVVQNPAMLFLLSFNLLIFGLLLVVGHNVWDSGWQILITIIGWLVLIKGILNLCFPQIATDMTQKITKMPSIWMASIIINIMLGLYLCYAGFIM